MTDSDWCKQRFKMCLLARMRLHITMHSTCKDCDKHHLYITKFISSTVNRYVYMKSLKSLRCMEGWGRTVTLTYRLELTQWVWTKYSDRVSATQRHMKWYIFVQLCRIGNRHSHADSHSHIQCYTSPSTDLLDIRQVTKALSHMLE